MLQKLTYLFIVLFVCLGSVHAAQPKENDATKALKISLDSWVFGESKETLEQKHPNINFIDLGDILRKFVLLRYEIINSRPMLCDYEDKQKNHQGFEFAAILHFSSKGGQEIKERRIYSVCKPDLWVVFGRK